jgi:hypothetical protein
MSKWLLCAAAAILPLCAAEREVPLPVALYTQFQVEPAPEVFSAMQREVENIMAPMGTEFEWRSLDGVNGSEVSAQLAVVKFFGHCNPGPMMPHMTLKTTALGWTHVSNGTILPFTDIDCDGIRQFLQFGLQVVDSKERPEVYGRALGRVLAHELYHIFANTAHHGSSGVAKPVYSVHDLLSKDFQFEERESEALRAGRPRSLIEVVDGTH